MSENRLDEIVQHEKRNQASLITAIVVAVILAVLLVMLYWFVF